MRFDEYGLLTMEQTPPPGSQGDSCAETFRYDILDQYVNATSKELTWEEWNTKRQAIYNALLQTKTDQGYLRHPLVPTDWREQDFTSDQFLPRLIVDMSFGNYEMWEFLERNKYCTNNPSTKIMQPGLLCAYLRANDSKWTILGDTIAILGQALLFRYLPYRWNDGKSKFEPMEESSCDYLNWFMLIVQCEQYGHTIASAFAKKLIPPSQIKQKVLQYYSNEPNSLWLLQLYEKAIDKVYEKSYDKGVS